MITFRKSILRKDGKLGSNHTVKFSKGTWHHIKIFGKERVHRKESCQSMSLKNAIREKDSSSEELDTLRKSGKRTTVITANEEVQTKEEAQVHVHDLELFVTVQILDDTPAVLSLGKLSAEHGCTYEWASGQKPHLTTQGKKIL